MTSPVLKMWCILLLLATGPAYASFDCANSNTAQEKAICASSELSAGDKEMAAAYRAALADAPPEMRETIRGDQHDWLGLLALYCPASPDQPVAKMVPCLKQHFALRAKALRQLVLRRGGVAFVWRSITLKVPEGPREEATGSPEAMPGYGTLSASWPQARAVTPEWTAWNKAVEAATRKIASNGQGDAAGKWLPEWAEENDSEVNATVGFAGDQLVTATVDGWWWRGAHPAEASMQLNWLLHEQRELRSEDLFRPGTDWAELTQVRCYKALTAQLGKEYESWPPGREMPKVLHEIISDPQNWQLDTKGLTIIFQDYAVAPRAAHPSPVTIPWPALRPFLQAGFEIPK